MDPKFTLSYLYQCLFLNKTLFPVSMYSVYGFEWRRTIIHTVFNKWHTSWVLWMCYKGNFNTHHQVFNLIIDDIDMHVFNTYHDTNRKQSASYWHWLDHQQALIQDAYHTTPCVNSLLFLNAFSISLYLSHNVWLLTFYSFNAEWKKNMAIANLGRLKKKRKNMASPYGWEVHMVKYSLALPYGDYLLYLFISRPFLSLMEGS